MTVAQIIVGLVIFAAIGIGAVLLVRWLNRSQATAIAEKTQADKQAFDAQRAALMTPTPEAKVIALRPDQVTDELNKL